MEEDFPLTPLQIYCETTLKMPFGRLLPPPGAERGNRARHCDSPVHDGYVTTARVVRVPAMYCCSYAPLKIQDHAKITV